jgi:hypothetical protein
MFPLPFAGKESRLRFYALRTDTLIEAGDPLFEAIIFGRRNE